MITEETAEVLPENQFVSPLGETTSNASIEETQSSDPFSDDILRIEGKGLCGLLERVPLWLKIITIALVASFGVFVLGLLFIVIQGFAIGNTTLAKNYIDTTVSLNALALALHDEIDCMVLQLANITDPAEKPLSVLRAVVDSEVVKYRSTMASFKRRYKLSPSALQQANLIDQTAANLTLWRSVLTDSSSSINQRFAALTGLNNYIGSQLDFSDDLNNMMNTYAASVNVYNAGVRFMTTCRKVFGLGMLVLLDTRRTVEIRTQYIASVGLLEEFDTLIQSFASGETLREFRNFDTSGADQVYQLSDYVISLNNNTNMTAGNWSLSVNMWMDKYDGLADIMKNAATQESAAKQTTSIGYFVLSFILPLVVFVLTILTTWGLSLTITGPWRRLNRIQDIAIKKFVPASMLAMIKCNNITDVDIGAHQQRKVVFVTVRIKGGTMTEGDASPAVTMQRFKKLYEYLGPVIRKHNGFVDNYGGEGFTAIFKTEREALNACLSLQRSASTFRTLGENVELLVIAHAARVIACAIGEHDRINGAFISDHLATLNSAIRFGLAHPSANFSILITKPVYKVVKEGVECRRVTTLQSVNAACPNTELYEILDGLDEKSRSREIWEDGMRLLEEHQYTEAITRFETCGTDDALAMEIVANVRRKINVAKKLFESWNLEDTLSEKSSVLPAYKEFCHSEKNEENILLYFEIEEYRNTIDREERAKISKRIIERYLNAVNLSESVKLSITHKQTTSTKESDVFKDLQSELMVNMKDSHARFKEKRLLNVLCQAQ